MNENENKIEIPDKKTELEERKLYLEILELERTWYKKPTFFVPTIVALSSLIILWSTGFFSTKVESLNNLITKLNDEKNKLIQLKIDLKKDSAKLNQIIINLTRDSIKLSHKIADLETYVNELNQNVKKITDSLTFVTSPEIQISVARAFTEKEVGFYITNGGSGTAYIRKIIVTINKKEIIFNGIDLQGFIDSILWEIAVSTPKLFRYELLSLNLPPGIRVPFLFVSKTDTSNFKLRADEFLNSIKGVKFHIIYSNKKGEIKHHFNQF